MSDPVRFRAISLAATFSVVKCCNHVGFRKCSNHLTGEQASRESNELFSSSSFSISAAVTDKPIITFHSEINALG